MNRRIVIGLTVMAAGRAMTLPFIGRAGDGGAGDPPAAWLMPLIGDAAIGIAAAVIAWLMWKRPSPAVWVIAIVWSAIGAFDALAAFIIDTSVPWPEFFMLEFFGRSMFFAAVALHGAIIMLLTRPSTRAEFGLTEPPIGASPVPA